MIARGVFGDVGFVGSRSGSDRWTDRRTDGRTRHGVGGTCHVVKSPFVASLRIQEGLAYKVSSDVAVGLSHRWTRYEHRQPVRSCAMFALRDVCSEQGRSKMAVAQSAEFSPPGSNLGINSCLCCGLACVVGRSFVKGINKHVAQTVPVLVNVSGWSGQVTSDGTRDGRWSQRSFAAAVGSFLLPPFRRMSGNGTHKVGANAHQVVEPHLGTLIISRFGW